MPDDLRTAFDQATARGDASVVSRWLLDPGGIARLAEFAILPRPEIGEVARDVRLAARIGGRLITAGIRATPTLIARLSRYCEDHGVTRIAALQGARNRYPDASDTEAMTAFLEDEL